jgi:translation initiation factor eIF-2B subunit beta
MAIALSNLGIETTLITDSAIFAVMARVNVCFIGANSVTANGGLVASAGTTALAMAAKSCMIPVCVCIGLFKLSPMQPNGTEQFDLCVSPESVLDLNDIDMNNVDAINPQMEYVSPDLVTLFVTNVGPHPPSYMEKLLPDFYSTDDNTLE